LPVRFRVDPDLNRDPRDISVLYIYLRPGIPLWQYCLYTLGRLISFLKLKRLRRSFEDHVLGRDPRYKGKHHLGSGCICDYMVLAGILTGICTYFAMLLVFALAYYFLHKPRSLRDVGLKLAGIIKAPY